MGKFVGPQLPYQKSQENAAAEAPLLTFDHHMEKSESFCDVTPEL